MAPLSPAAGLTPMDRRLEDIVDFEVHPVITSAEAAECVPADDA
jgi:hypothetical protein